MEYSFSKIEKKWQKYWAENKVYKVEVDKSKPKYYVLDMFPYPSGAGLHVGHPLGYIASDIYSRYKRLKGFNVLHPMGFDAFGLPAEQYAIQTGQHPDITTKENIARYREQLDLIGFSYDWDREIRTCDPAYYKWTQWAFVKMFNSYYCFDAQKAFAIEGLIRSFEKQGSEGLNIACSEELVFTAGEWLAKSEKEKQELLLNYRLAYLADTMVNWCPALGTVLANDEVVNGLSERGGHPVEQRKMRQWSLRISAYAQRLLDGLDIVEWTDSLKEMQRNWIGRSEGSEILFKVKDSDIEFEVFTTRADTIFGVTFMVLAPESELVDKLCTPEQRAIVDKYIENTKKKTERERIADRRVTGVFSGAYAINPFSNEAIPVWISDYVLAGYGTGAIMAVPAHDSRDYAFAKHFNLPIVPLIEGCDISKDSFDAKEGVMVNSGFLNGLNVKEAIPRAIDEVEKRGLGKRRINFRLRDAIFGRQRYWGEPFPVYYKEGLPYVMPENELPLCLPQVDKFLPTETGEPPLGRAKNWTYQGYPLELSTMPGFAGSSAYYLRYMDPHNNEALVSKEADEYWQDVDLYLGGTEHATGHLIYSRFWNKFLFDLGISCKEEPFKKLVNQGMIQGRTAYAYRLLVYKTEKDYFEESNVITSNWFVSSKYYFALEEGRDILPAEVKEQIANTVKADSASLRFRTQHIRVDVALIHDDILNKEAFKTWRAEFADALFLGEDALDGDYLCGRLVEKMSKSYFNVVNPDDIIKDYGADTLRMYEMFLGPLEQSKPWDTKGIDGVHRFLKKLWRLFFNEQGLCISEEAATKAELKILHRTIKKIQEDIENFSFNTSVSAFMICVNELTDLKCNKREILEPLIVLLSPFAPHIAEELHEIMGGSGSIVQEVFPKLDESVLVENSFEYPVSFNGKMRFKKEYALDLNSAEIEKDILEDNRTEKFLEGKNPKKIIVVKGKIINIVM